MNGKIERMQKILDDHGIPNYVQNGHLYADSMLSGYPIFYEVEDLTNYSRSELYSWLGY